MLAQDQIDTLAALPIFEPVPRTELEWLGARGRIERDLNDGKLDFTSQPGLTVFRVRLPITVARA